MIDYVTILHPNIKKSSRKYFRYLLYLEDIPEQHCGKVHKYDVENFVEKIRSSVTAAV